MTPEERRDYIALNTGDTVSGKRRRKETEAERKKKARRSRKLKRIRKYRTKMMRAKGPGMKTTIMLPGGKRKKVRKKFYLLTYDAKGNPTGQLWYTSNKPDEDEIDAYRKANGVKHPFQLTVVSPEAMAKKRGKKK